MKYNFELHLDLLLHLYCDVPLLKGNLTNFNSYHDKIPEGWEESHNAHYCKSYGPTNKIPQMLKKGGSKMGYELFAHYCLKVVEARLEGLGHVGDVGEQEEARAKECSPEQKGFKAIGATEQKGKDAANETANALGGHSYASSGLDEFCVPCQEVQETHVDVYFFKNMITLIDFTVNQLIRIS